MRHGRKAMDKLFWDIQALVVRTIRAVDRLVIHDKQSFEVCHPRCHIISAFGRQGWGAVAAASRRQRPSVLLPPTQKKCGGPGGWLCFLRRSCATDLAIGTAETDAPSPLKQHTEDRGGCTATSCDIAAESSFSGTTCSWTKLFGRGCSRSTPPLR